MHISRSFLALRSACFLLLCKQYVARNSSLGPVSWTGIRTPNSAMPMPQCSTRWAIRPTVSWSFICVSMISPWMMDFDVCIYWSKTENSSWPRALWFLYIKLWNPSRIELRLITDPWKGWLFISPSEPRLIKDQGPVSRKSRELFGPEKPFVKLRPAYSVKLVFSYVVKGMKIKITAKFRASRRLRFEDTKKIMSPEIRPKSFGTFEKRAPDLESTYWRNLKEDISRLNLSVLQRRSPTIPFETKQIMDNALILPYFDHSSCLWGYIGIGLTERKKLQQLKNRVARILALSNYETRSKDLLDDLGWEVLVDRRIRKLAILMYKITHNISPPC